MRIPSRKAYLALLDALQARGALNVQLTLAPEDGSVVGLNVIMRPSVPAGSSLPGLKAWSKNAVSDDMTTDIESGEKEKAPVRRPPGLGHLE